jgi:hypothetical protein
MSRKGGLSVASIGDVGLEKEEGEGRQGMEKRGSYALRKRRRAYAYMPCLMRGSQFPHAGLPSGRLLIYIKDKRLYNIFKYIYNNLCRFWFTCTCRTYESWLRINCILL